MGGRTRWRSPSGRRCTWSAQAEYLSAIGTSPSTPGGTAHASNEALKRRRSCVTDNVIIYFPFRSICWAESYFTQH